MPYKSFKKNGKWLVFKVDGDNQPTGEALGEHDSEDQANKQVKALYASEDKHGAEFVFCDEFTIVTRPGDPYRLFKFGKLYKNGVEHDITPAYAKTFKLPHFRPPIKLGSHDDRCPAGGHIVGLEVREDGLYAITEMNDQGAESMNRGDYRYHSPEVIWDETIGLEDPTTGEVIPGPYIVGDALLHTPHMGEAAALYSYQVIHKEVMQMTEMIEVPKTLWERFTAWLDKRTADPDPAPVEPAKTEPSAPAAPVVELDKFEALQAERDALATQAKEAADKLAAIEAEKQHAEMISGIVAQLQEKDKFGSMFIEMKDCEEAAGMLGGMSPEQREWCMRRFSADAAKINLSAVYGEKGSDGAGANNPDALDAAIKAKMGEKGLTYLAAFELVRAEQPGLFTVTAPK